MRCNYCSIDSRNSRTITCLPNILRFSFFICIFNVKYTDEKGESQYVWQTCYGPAISRIYAAVIATHGDDKGLILPFDIAPLQIVIIPIHKTENREKVMK